MTFCSIRTNKSLTVSKFMLPQRNDLLVDHVNKKPDDHRYGSNMM